MVDTRDTDTEPSSGSGRPPGSRLRGAAGSRGGRWLPTSRCTAEARKNRLAYQLAKVATLLLAAAVTVLAAIGAPAALSASLAAAIVVVEGLQQLFQWHANWIAYRASAETLRRHAFAYAARTPPYDADDRADRLANALGELTERENLGGPGR